MPFQVFVLEQDRGPVDVEPRELPPAPVGNQLEASRSLAGRCLLSELSPNRMLDQFADGHAGLAGAALELPVQTVFDGDGRSHDAEA